MFIETTVFLFVYMLIYNCMLIVIFWTLQQFISFNFKTIYSFSDLKFNYFFVSALTIVLFSMAGVPPFLGFFSKLLLLILLTNSSFAFFFMFFFGLLFFGLYFYLQNIRFLYSTGFGKIDYSFHSILRAVPLYFYFTQVILFFAIFGFFFMDDLLLYFFWIFI